MNTKAAWRRAFTVELDGARQHLAVGIMTAAAGLVAAVMAVARDNPFGWLALLLAVAACIGVWPAFVWRETGALLARAGVVLSLLTGQLEYGSGPHYYKAGAAWLGVAALFSLQALFIHLLGHQRQRLESELTNRASAAREADAVRRHEALLIAIRGIDVAPPPAQRRAPTVCGIAASVLVGAALLLRGYVRRR